MTEYWPDCPVEGCPNKICLALNSDRCFPHTPGNKHVKGWKIDAGRGVGASVLNRRGATLAAPPLHPAPQRSAS